MYYLLINDNKHLYGYSMPTTGSVNDNDISEFFKFNELSITE